MSYSETAETAIVGIIKLVTSQLRLMMCLRRQVLCYQRCSNLQVYNCFPRVEDCGFDLLVEGYTFLMFVLFFCEDAVFNAATLASFPRTG